jgi:exonuclease VII large subunit
MFVSFYLCDQRFAILTSASLDSGLSLESTATGAQAPADKQTPPIDKPKQADPEEMRKTIRRLTTEIEHLRNKVAELERILQFNSVHDRLTKEEQRVENLQAQLLETAEKEAGLQTRMDELNEQLRPENIDHLQVLGSLRPEQVRDATRRRLTGEKQRLQSQLDLLQQNHKRLQASVTVNDLVIQRLRTQLQGTLQQ